MNTLQVRCGASDSTRGLLSASGLITALALFFGMSGCFLSRIAAASEAIAPMIAGGGALILLSLLSKTRRGGKIAFFCIIAGLIAALLALDLTGGLCAAFNRASAAAGARLAYNLPRLAASEEALPAALYAISILLAPICIWIVRVRAAFIGWLIALALFLPDALIGMAAPDICIAALVCGLLMLRLPAQLPARGAIRALPAAICVLLAFALAFSVICVPAAQDGFAWLHDLHDAAQARIDTCRFGASSETGLPQGDFSNLGALRRTDASMLEITMRQPESLYLRGYVGSQYLENGWRAANPESLWDGADLFYWLHRDGFYGETQLSALSALLDSDANAPIEISVRHTGARRDVIYAPYELIAADHDLPDAADVGDIRLRRPALRGLDGYTLTSAENLVSRYAALSGALADRESDASNEALQAYLTDESHYNRFVYAHFLDMPDDARALMTAIFGKYEHAENAHLDYAQAKRRILNWLSENIEYSESAAPRAEGADFLTDFLTNAKSGYDVHYAAAAAMMMRYFGIPARYVEGYLITPDDAESMRSDAPYTIAETNAHAWTEIYQDGVGWIPFETAPKYLNLMPQADRLSGSGSAQDQPQNEMQDDMPLPESSLDMTDDFHEDPEDQDADRPESRLAIYLIAAAAMLLMLAALILLLRRAIARMQRRRAFRRKDRRAAVLSLYEYLFELMKRLYGWRDCVSPSGFENTVRADLGQDMAAKYMRAMDICRSAAFSDTAVAESDYQFVYRFVQKTRRLVKKRLPLRKRRKL